MTQKHTVTDTHQCNVTTGSFWCKLMTKRGFLDPCDTKITQCHIYYVHKCIQVNMELYVHKCIQVNTEPYVHKCIQVNMEKTRSTRRRLPYKWKGVCRNRVSERERDSVCVKESESVSVSERERERERKRERGRERERDWQADRQKRAHLRRDKWRAVDDSKAYSDRHTSMQCNNWIILMQVEDKRRFLRPMRHKDNQSVTYLMYTNVYK